jgi:hypothetical protein
MTPTDEEHGDVAGVCPHNSEHQSSLLSTLSQGRSLGRQREELFTLQQRRRETTLNGIQAQWLSNPTRLSLKKLWICYPMSNHTNRLIGKIQRRLHRWAFEKTIGTVAFTTKAFSQPVLRATLTGGMVCTRCRRRPPSFVQVFFPQTRATLWNTACTFLKRCI